MENQRVHYRSVREKYTILLVSLLAAMTIVLTLLISIIFGFNLVQNLVLGWIVTTLYAITAFLIVDPKIVKEIEKPVLEIRQVPVEVPVYRTIDNPIVQVVEKEVPVVKEIIKPVIRTIEKKVYVERKRKKLNITKYKFVGSSQEKRYHKRTCRLGKLIKKKFKVHSNSQSFFKKKHFKACKVCVKK